MITHQAKDDTFISSAIAMILGSLLLTLGSCIKIPFYPVPFTGHTLVLFILALTQPPKKAAGSALFYLLWASMGLPVLGGVANSLWFISKSAGYLLSFPIAAYCIAVIARVKSPWLAICIGQLVIFICGFLGLFPLVGASIALTKGVLFFLPSAFVKGLLATQIAGRIHARY
ncbi:MAG: biotin transporter BioY [Simkaniaceae bacterium]|nr:biotin transporter BioY [Candidatus Sacchlamyda saccharinae]